MPDARRPDRPWPPGSPRAGSSPTPPATGTTLLAAGRARTSTRTSASTPPAGTRSPARRRSAPSVTTLRLDVDTEADLATPRASVSGGTRERRSTVSAAASGPRAPGRADGADLAGHRRRDVAEVRTSWPALLGRAFLAGAFLAVLFLAGATSWPSTARRLLGRSDFFAVDCSSTSSPEPSSRATSSPSTCSPTSSRSRLLRRRRARRLLRRSRLLGVDLLRRSLLRRSRLLRRRRLPTSWPEPTSSPERLLRRRVAGRLGGSAGRALRGGGRALDGGLGGVGRGLLDRGEGQRGQLLRRRRRRP